MHDELIKRLREPCQYENCVLCQQAADAIEELSKLADEIPHVCECCVGCEMESGGCDTAFVLSPKRAIEYLSKPHWIPVTERKKLPKSGSYLVAYKVTEDSKPMVGISEIAWWSTRSDAFEPFYKHGVTHWMPKPSPPLPEPPKEEHDG